MKNKNTGFTLIELLVVIVIIGILATIAIPLFKKHLTQAYDATKEEGVYNIGITIFANYGIKINNYDTIIDGATATTLADIKNILQKQGVVIPESKSGYQYWYFSKDNNFIIATCRETTPGIVISHGTISSSDHIECITNNKIPKAIIGGLFENGVNFQLIP